jgi:BON domain
MMTLSKDVEPRRIAPESGLAERIEGQIAQRASGRIRDLRVVCEDGQITLSGRSRTYHAKQLALQAVLDLTDGRDTLANQIVVC